MPLLSQSRPLKDTYESSSYFVTHRSQCTTEAGVTPNMSSYNSRDTSIHPIPSSRRVLFSLEVVRSSEIGPTAADGSAAVKHVNHASSRPPGLPQKRSIAFNMNDVEPRSKGKKKRDRNLMRHNLLRQGTHGEPSRPGPEGYAASEKHPEQRT